MKKKMILAVVYQDLCCHWDVEIIRIEFAPSLLFLLSGKVQGSLLNQN